MEWLLGHLVGDYPTQSRGMNRRKSERTWSGFALCCMHVPAKEVPSGK